ncbi:C4-dicarboxylate TRAP transporter substrate-binding protein [Halomonas sp. ML-15]|uniref:C4-dicarboxylate TRAP transporter substrate-binding protein n=1 Tax=Halomonas sp. ML-15 TaxID=2773305 RepID=UPI001747D00E|nr:C4-dicarboxylate TRAP transporter substrate-binding protein [Halomonas sp. ML-15]MBD3895299.1 C4-dicarboxylate TRAP transporter substrate-binding protein [Halomonas sp. ML-15]
MKKMPLLLGLSGVLLLVSACGQDATEEGATSNEVYKLSVGIAMNDRDPMYEGVVRFKEAVESRTEGGVEVEVFSSSQLGSTADLLEQARVGANVSTLTDAGPLGDIVREISILQAPYIVDNLDEGRELVASDLFKGWEAELEPEGLKVLSFNWFQGERHLATTRPVLTPDDLSGMAIRTNGTSIVNKAIEVMGGNPTGLAWAESYPGLQQGVIDGVEAHYSAIHGARLPEVIDSIAKTGHFQLLTALTVGTQWFDRLPPEYQEILVEESVDAGEFASSLNVEKSREYEETMAAEGVSIHQVDVASFRERSDRFYDEFEDFKELREEIDEYLGK